MMNILQYVNKHEYDRMPDTEFRIQMAVIRLGAIVCLGGRAYDEVGESAHKV